MQAGYDPREVVTALAEHEEAIGALYSAYAKQYPEVAHLWETMASAEYAHGQRLRSLPERAANLDSFVDVQRYDLEAIRSETKKLRNLVQVTPYAGVSLVEAFRAAGKLEDSLIEREVLTAHDGDDPEVAAVLTTLHEETQRHRQHLSESLAQHT
jgi:rubrerythrin